MGGAADEPAFQATTASEGPMLEEMLEVMMEEMIEEMI